MKRRRAPDQAATGVDDRAYGRAFDQLLLDRLDGIRGAVAPIAGQLAAAERLARSQVDLTIPRSLLDRSVRDGANWRYDVYQLAPEQTTAPAGDVAVLLEVQRHGGELLLRFIGASGNILWQASLQSVDDGG